MTKAGVSEPLFASEYLAVHPMRCIDGRFCTVDGMIENEEELRAAIYRELEPYVFRGISKLVSRILDVMRLKANAPRPEINENIIHVANGTYHLTEGFTHAKDYCSGRLSVNYNPEAPVPEVWLAFLEQLLEPADILTLQEYLGYCLVPTTKAQKMMMIVGEGGEGKSRIGLVMRALLGECMNVGSIQKVETNQFARADLEYKLLLVDDDMRMEALPSTSYLKSLITAEDRMDVERKGKQSYQARLYCRFLCFGNGTLSSLHDRSAGFFRRQIILRTKPRPAGRRDAPDLIDFLLEEKEGILLWCLEGLRNLRKNNYRFTLSAAARANLTASMKENNNILEFMKSEGYMEYHPEWCATSKQICSAYEKWCDDNAVHPMSGRSLIGYLRDHQETYGISYTNAIPKGETKVRGFRGLRVR